MAKSRPGNRAESLISCLAKTEKSAFHVSFVRTRVKSGDDGGT